MMYYSNRGSLKLGGKERGLTLIELMITFTLIVIILSYSAPNFQKIVEDNNVKSAANELLGAINYVRSESIRQSAAVVLCPSKDREACLTNGKWELGVLAFIDDNADGVRNTDEKKLRGWKAKRAGISIRGSTPIQNNISYNSIGRATQTGVFAICHNDQLTKARSITVATLRPRLGVDTNSDHIPEKDSGLNSINITSCTSP